MNELEFWAGIQGGLAVGHALEEKEIWKKLRRELSVK